MELVYKKLFEKQPDEKTGVLCMAAQCDTDETLMKYRTLVGRSDTFSGSQISFSEDGGETYSEPVSDRTRWETPEGTMTRYFKAGLIDPATNRFYMFYNVGLLPNDQPHEGLQSWNIHYAMKDDCKNEPVFEKPVVMTGHNFGNPINGVYAREEKSTGDIIVYCTAMWQSLYNIYLNADSYEYRLKP